VVDGEGDDKKLVVNPRFEQEVGEALKGGPKPLVCACFGGRRGAAAATVLSDAGFDDVSNLVGGVGAWAKEGRAVVGNVEPPFDHDPSAH
jgi:rhodanese-related sulfurtransferase